VVFRVSLLIAQHPVSIDPAWQPVPLLATATHD